MRQQHGAVAALFLLFALLVGACTTAGAATPNSATPDPSTSRPSASSPAVAGRLDPPRRADPDPHWQLSPPWALEPELLRGSPQFRRLLRRGEPTPGQRPNIVLITTDDQTMRELRWMRKTRALLGGPGADFRGSISPHPLCCPARAEILTGQFAQNNGVRSNFWPSGGYYALDSTNTLPVWLRAAGYQTAFMGKYLNEYGQRDQSEVPPGWDHWRATVGTVYDYYNFGLNENGTLRSYPGVYQTDFYADHTEGLIPRLAAADRPFFLWQSHLAPHTACPSSLDVAGGSCWTPPPPAVQHAGRFDDVVAPSRTHPAYDEKDVSDKPRLIRRLPRIGPGRERYFTELAQGRLAALQSVDDAVARTVSALRDAGVLDDTLIVFTSDNGYLLGEHRYAGKILAYEPSLRVPLLMRGPGVPSGVVSRETVATVDLAPTILAAAKARAGVTLDGRDLRPVASGDAPGWDTILVQGGPQPSLGPKGGGDWLYRGVRTRRYTYVEYAGTGERELYDRRRDPAQLRNVTGRAAYERTETELRGRLRQLADCSGADCRRTFGPVPAP